MRAIDPLEMSDALASWSSTSPSQLAKLARCFLGALVGVLFTEMMLSAQVVPVTES